MYTPCTDHGKVGNRKGYHCKRWNGKMHTLHRVVYVQHHGVTMASISGLVIRHTCDNPRCINPDHLMLGSYSDNTQDAKTRGRMYHKLEPWQRDFIVANATKGNVAKVAKVLGLSRVTVYKVINQ